MRNRRPASSDRLRLDVATTLAGEVYSWAGESRLGERNLVDLVGGSRAISTGNFSGIPAVVFVKDRADFAYAGTAATEGRSLMEFRFRVPRERSHFGLGRGGEYRVAYEGSVFVDPRREVLARVALRNVDVPDASTILRSVTTVEYGPVQLNGADYILPRKGLLRVVYKEGSVDENRITYTGYREFLGESTVNFGNPQPAGPRGAEAAAKPDRTREAVELPPGLAFTVALTDPLNTATAAAGDPIRGRLETPIQDRKTATVVPQGAAILGRLVRFERRYPAGMSPLVLLVILFENLEWAGGRAAVSATSPGAKRKFQTQGVGITSFGGVQVDIDRPDVALVVIDGVKDDHVVPQGFRVKLVTSTPPLAP
jgi:hypothetical protein